MKYYICWEDDNVWSYREDTEEQLIVILVDEETKQYITLCEHKRNLTKILKKKGYTQTTTTQNIKDFLG